MKKLFGFIFVFISYFFFAQEAEKKDSVQIDNEIVTDIELLHKKPSYSFGTKNNTKDTKMLLKQS